MKKQAEEAIVLAMEIIQERNSINNRPDVVPSYIKNRPVPIADPFPKIGPLSKTGNQEQIGPANSDNAQYEKLTLIKDEQEDLYLDLGQHQQQHPPAIMEEQYLDLDQAKEEYLKTAAPVEMIEPDLEI